MYVRYNVSPSKVKDVSPSEDKENTTNCRLVAGYKSLPILSAFNQSSQFYQSKIVKIGLRLVKVAPPNPALQGRVGDFCWEKILYLSPEGYW